MNSRRGRLLLAVVWLCTVAHPTLAAPAEERTAVVVPETIGARSGLRFTVNDTEAGAYLQTDQDPAAAWQTLLDMLARLRIPVVERSADRYQLITDWVSWKVDPKTGHAFSDTGLLRKLIFSPLHEHHRFRLWLAADPAGARLHSADQDRLAEVNITPDTEYTWIEWRERPPQPAAARTFLRHVQGGYESALVTRLVNTPTAAVSAPRPAAPSPSIVVTPAPSAAAPVALAQPEEPIAAPAKASAAAPPVPSEPPAAALRREPAADIAQRPSTPAELPPAIVRATPAVTAAVPSATPTAPRQPDNALLIRAPQAQAWSALQDTLARLDMPVSTRDASQGVIVTDWLEYRYDADEGSFEPNPDESQALFYGLSGPKRQRHRFQLLLSPGSEAGTTLVYAYHQAFEARAFRSPGSDDLATIWETRPPGRDVAMAFLRRLSFQVRLGATVGRGLEPETVMQEQPRSSGDPYLGTDTSRSGENKPESTGNLGEAVKRFFNDIVN